MKKTLIVIFLTLIAGGGNLRADDNSMQPPVMQYFSVGNPVVFGGEDYYLAWSARPYDFYMLQEYLPKGQGFEDYTRMLTVSVMFIGDAPMNASKAVDYKIAELEEVKKTDPLCNYIVSENDGKYLLEFMVSNLDDATKPKFVEVDIHYYRDIEINGIKANYLVFYSCRAYGEDMEPFIKSIPMRREKWYKDPPGLEIMPEFQFKK